MKTLCLVCDEVTDNPDNRKKFSTFFKIDQARVVYLCFIVFIFSVNGSGLDH